MMDRDEAIALGIMVATMLTLVVFFLSAGPAR